MKICKLTCQTENIDKVMNVTMSYLKQESGLI